MKSIAAALVASFVLLGCGSVPVRTKVEVQERLVSQTQKDANYLKLARYWDQRAEKQTIDFKGASFLTIWEKEGRAEITIGNGPYFGMIELIGVGENSTLIKSYAWGGMSGRISEWTELIKGAPAH